MTDFSTYQLPDDIRMPPRFARYPCYQIWFFDGAQTALEGHSSLDLEKLRREKGASVADAYQAGYKAGQQYRATSGIASPSRTPTSAKGRPRTWFVAGLDDGLKGRQPMNDARLRHRYGDSAANEYRAGYEAAQHQ